MEEITVDIWTDLGQMYRDPPKFVRFQERLRDIRIVIIHTCRSLVYIEEECRKLGLVIDSTSIERRRRAQRSPDHPYNILATYLKPGLAWFHDYSAFADTRQIDGDDETDEWECWSTSDVPMESSGSLATSTSSDESLESDHSMILGHHCNDEGLAKGGKFDMGFNHDTPTWPGVLVAGDEFQSYGDDTWDGAIVVVP